MRIIGGLYKGRRLAAPDTPHTRPTSDRAREAIFNSIDSFLHRQNRTFDGMRVLDLFAGTGAFGFESLSRGAAFAAFVDHAIEAVKVIHLNGSHLQLDPVCYRVFRRDATLLPAMTAPPYDVVFLDPPYDQNVTLKTLRRLQEGGYIGPHTVMVVEISARSEFIAPPWFQIQTDVRHGAARVIIGSVVDQAPISKGTDQ